MRRNILGDDITNTISKDCNLNFFWCRVESLDVTFRGMRHLGNPV